MNETLVPASFNKRIFSFLFDLVCLVAPTLIFFFGVTNNFMFSSLGGKTAESSLNAFEIDSGLLQGSYDGSGNLTGTTYYAFDVTSGAEQSQDGYAAYFEKIFNYYSLFLPSNANTQKTGSDGTLYTAQDFVTFFDVHILQLPEPSAITDVNDEAQIQQVVSSTSGLSVAYFKYAVKNGAIDLLSRPVLTAKYQSLVEARDVTALTSLSTYFYAASNAYSGLYYDTVQDLTGYKSANYLVYQSYAYSLNLRIAVDRWLCYIVLYVPLDLILFLVVPFILKDGKTFGKKIFKLAVIGKNGYSASPFASFAHYFWLFLLTLIPMWPNIFLGLMAFAIVGMIDYLVLSASKDHRSLHDKMSGTQVVDAQGSKWFASPEAERQYFDLHPDERPEPVSSEDGPAENEGEVLDRSTMNKNREEAASMRSFDELEQNVNGNAPSASSTPSKKKVNLHKEEEPKEPESK